MSEETTGKSSKVWLYTMCLILGLPLLYVLSIGPALVLIFRGAPEPVEFAFKTLYMPLDQFAQATNTQGLFQTYAEVWLKVTGTNWPPIK